MFCAEKTENANFQADYANQADFRERFEKDTKSLYLLAFLLTANHSDSEKCFVETVEESSQQQKVFREWIQSWIKRGLIKNAIRIAAPGRTPDAKRDEWGIAEIDGVAQLPALERFVFVMTLLENFTTADCALLLGLSKENVVRLRSKALTRLPLPQAGPHTFVAKEAKPMEVITLPGDSLSALRSKVLTAFANLSRGLTT
jgi:DNA-directed RNA polymerase specialized sigma24 family protein